MGMGTHIRTRERMRATAGIQPLARGWPVPSAGTECLHRALPRRRHSGPAARRTADCRIRQESPATAVNEAEGRRGETRTIAQVAGLEGDERRR